MNVLLTYCDDTKRRIISNWKKQNKSRKQWGKNIKDNNSIRYSFIDDEEEFNIDELLL